MSQGEAAPFHGRAYLWDGGGLTVDHSPNGFGSSDVLIAGVAPEVSAQWQHLFAAWWAIGTVAP